MTDPNAQTQMLRVLFCIGVTQTFFDEDSAKVKAILEAIETAFSNLSGRFGLQVLGTIDDDQSMVGSSPNWPWTCYILADAPNLEAVHGVCNLLRESEIERARLWRYLKIEARIGRRLFFGND
jgi:hypothetical protein